METVNILGQVRSSTGKRSSRAARRAGLVPCEMYGGNKNIHFEVSPKALKSLVYTAEFKIANVEVEGKVHRTIMKSIQFHPVTDAIQHVDFLLLEEGRNVKIDVPVRFTGAAPGVKAGGTLTQKLHSVQIKVIPQDLVDQVFVDISELELGDSVRVKDIVVSEGVEIVNNLSIPVASVEVPRALRSADAEEEEDTEEAGEEPTAAAAE